MTVTASARPDLPQGLPAALRAAVALAVVLTVITVALAGIFASAASARTLRRPETRVGAFGLAGGQIVGAHPDIPAGQRRARAPTYDQLTVGSCVAAETPTSEAPRFVAASNGDVLDLPKVEISGPSNSSLGKIDYLMGRVDSAASISKGNIFAGSLGFDDSGLDAALRNQLVDNFYQSPLGPPGFDGEAGRLTINSPITGPSGLTMKIESVWQFMQAGNVRFLTAYPG